MRKVLFLLGTRPEAIKLAPVIRTFQQSGELAVQVCSTSQHREMLDQVLTFFQVKVDFDLKVMEPNQSLSDLTVRIIKSLSATMVKLKPDWLIVQGDTTTAMAGALSGFYQKLKIAHVEAGLRSFNLNSPFPEEMNRLVVSKLAYCHFCPTKNAVQNLALEGINKNVFEVGNTVIDALLLGKRIVSQKNSDGFPEIFGNIDFKKRIILVTCHRRESFGDPFLSICSALIELAEANEDIVIVYPVHLNPNVQDKAKAHLNHPRIHLMAPLSYPHFLWLMDKSFMILTDSGGIQEEAPSLHKPVIVLRDVTERIESIEAGTAILAGTSREKIVRESQRILSDKSHHDRMTAIANPYGDGKSAERILEIVRKLS